MLKKISSYLRNETAVHEAFLKVLMQRRWQNRDVLELLRLCGYTVSPSQLSVFIRHGGKQKGGMTDHDVLVLLGAMGITLHLDVNISRPTESKIRRHFDHFFPADLYPKENKIQEKVLKLYNENDMLYK